MRPVFVMNTCSHCRPTSGTGTGAELGQASAARREWILAGALASTGAGALAEPLARAAVALTGILAGALASTGAEALAETLAGAVVAPTRILAGTLAGALARLRPHARPPMARRIPLAHEIMVPCGPGLWLREQDRIRSDSMIVRVMMWVMVVLVMMMVMVRQ